MSKMKSVLVWRMGMRDAKKWDRWYWSKEYATFEDLMQASMGYLKANPGVVTRIITRTTYVPVAE